MSHLSNDSSLLESVLSLPRLWRHNFYNSLAGRFTQKFFLFLKLYFYFLTSLFHYFWCHAVDQINFFLNRSYLYRRPQLICGVVCAFCCCTTLKLPCVMTFATKQKSRLQAKCSRVLYTLVHAKSARILLANCFYACLRKDRPPWGYCLLQRKLLL